MDVDSQAGSKRRALEDIEALEALPDDLESEETFEPLSETLEEEEDPPTIAYGYSYTEQPIASLASQLVTDNEYVAPYTTGIFSWSAAYQHGGFIDGRVWASGLRWPVSYQKESAVADIQAALTSAGVPVDAYESGSIYVSTPYGAANRNLSGGSFSITFVNLQVAERLVRGGITVMLPVFSSAHGESVQGSPLWTKDPGAVQLAKED
jgi:hypothetical protein